MDLSMQSNPFSKDQFVEFVSSIANEIAGISSSNEPSTEEYHISTEKSSRLHEYNSNTDSPTKLIEVPSKFQINDRAEEARISEALDTLFSDSSSSQASSTAFELKATVDSETISDTSLRIDNSENLGTSLYVTSEMMLSLNATSPSLSENSNSITYDDSYTSTTDNAKFSMKTINFNSIINSTTIFSEESKTDESIAPTTDGSIRKTTEFLTHLDTSTISETSTSDISDFEHSLEDRAPASTSINFDDLIISQKNSFSLDRKDKSMKTSEESFVGPNATQTEFKESMLTESVPYTTIAGNDHDTNMSDISDVTETGSSTREVDNEASVLKGFVTTNKPLITNNVRQFIPNDFSSFTETLGTVRVTDASETEDYFFEDSKLSTMATTNSADNRITETDHELIGDNELSDISFAASIAATINDDEITTADDFTVKSLIFPSEGLFNISETIKTSTLSNSSMENFIGTGITQNTVRGLQNAISVTDNETELINKIEKISPISVFNITLPALLYDVQFTSLINRTNNIYKYILLDEVSYKKETRPKIFDRPKIDFVMDDEPNSLDNFENDANETNSDFYSDISLASVDDTKEEEKFRLANLAARKKYKMQLQLSRTTDQNFLQELSITSNSQPEIDESSTESSINAESLSTTDDISSNESVSDDFTTEGTSTNDEFLFNEDINNDEEEEYDD